MTKIRVLIVDDHTLFRESLRSLLDADDSIEVVGEAGDGIEAIAKALQLRPKVVLMDIAMPHMSGVQATRRMKKENPSVEVLALSMYETEQHIVEMLRAGVSGYISKRAPARELVSAIQAVSRGDAFLDSFVTRKVLDRCREQIKRGGREEIRGRLTARELEILCFIAEGTSNKEIAELLSIDIHTVQTHRLNLMRKLGVHDRTELVRYAIREGLITP